MEKVVRLGGLAGDIARHPFLGHVLALKGGTALNLCYGPPKRLSVDLDYNYIGEVGELLALGPNEEIFLSAVQNGELLTDLLFQSDHEEAQRVAGHPAVQWKIENTRGHVSKGGKKRKGPLPSKQLG
jgi:predicted nucleotidyltransferase component of viral defense system